MGTRQGCGEEKEGVEEIVEEGRICESPHTSTPEGEGREDVDEAGVTGTGQGSGEEEIVEEDEEEIIEEKNVCENPHTCTQEGEGIGDGGHDATASPTPAPADRLRS